MWGEADGDDTIDILVDDIYAFDGKIGMNYDACKLHVIGIVFVDVCQMETVLI